MKGSKKLIFMCIIIFSLVALSVYITTNIIKIKTLEEIKEENKINKKQFSMYVENNTGSYEEYNDNYFPNNLKYVINIDKSECIDVNGNIVEDIITVNENNTLTVTSNKTVYCYLYYDLDKEAPVINTFYIGGSTNPEYTTTTSTSIYITHNEEDVESYCVTENNTSDNCEWINTSEKEITIDYTLTNTDGEKMLYAYIKDMAGNISNAVSDTITYDGTAPTVTASLSGNQTASVKAVIKSSEAGTYCINTSSTASNMNNCKFSGSISANTSITTSAFNTSGTYYVHVKDAAGNYGISSAIIVQTQVGKYLLANPSTGLNTSAQGGLYRYQGTTADNYICFGTSNKSTCTGNTDAYMYRIIGINSSGQLKLIKKEALGSTMQWYSNYTTDIKWPSSTIYSNINGSSFLTNTTYVPSGWSDKIATTTWKYGDNTTYNTTASNLYSIENAWTNTVSAKIGLWYMHDYYYGMNGGNNCSDSGAYTTCKTSWIFLWRSGNDTAAPNTSYEWTMSRYGYSSSASRYYAWSVASNGRVHNTLLTTTYSVRPVFFLKSSVEYISGSGTLDDPFIIK